MSILPDIQARINPFSNESTPLDIRYSTNSIFPTKQASEKAIFKLVAPLEIKNSTISIPEKAAPCKPIKSYQIKDLKDFFFYNNQNCLLLGK